MVARAYKLENLLIIIDRNQYQANCKTEDLLPLEPLADKFTAFGCSIRSINGHSFDELNCALAEFPFARGQASVIIANTIRGRGIVDFEDRADSWFMELSESDADALEKVLY